MPHNAQYIVHRKEVWMSWGCESTTRIISWLVLENTKIAATQIYIYLQFWLRLHLQMQVTGIASQVIGKIQIAQGKSLQLATNHKATNLSVKKNEGSFPSIFFKHPLHLQHPMNTNDCPKSQGLYLHKKKKKSYHWCLFCLILT